MRVQVWSARRACFATVALLAALLCAALANASAASANNGTVLILEPTVQGGASSREALAAEEAGEKVEVVTASQWEAMSTAQFAEYDALVLGDPSCTVGEGPIAAADANAAAWNAAVSGNVIVIGTDPDFHANGGIEGAKTLIKDGVAFTVEKKGRTGAYIDLSCYYAEANTTVPVPMLANLSKFGGFTTYGQFRFSGCPAESHIVATSPALSGLTDEALSNWTCSAHEAFEEWPADFEVLVINKNIGENYTASDGTKGGPYILARGATVISNIKLTPLEATNPIGAPHTVTATVTEEGKPVNGTAVTFEVVAGPNAGLVETAVTDEEGQATFTYTSKVAGTDVLHATFVDSLGHTETSNTVEKTWEEQAPECSKVHGNGHWGPRGPEGGNLGDRLSTNLGERQELQTTAPNKELHLHLTHLASASCVASAGGFEFSGSGSAKVNHHNGYVVSFTLALSGGHTYYTLVIEKEGTVVYALIGQQLRRDGTEHFS